MKLAAYFIFINLFLISLFGCVKQATVFSSPTIVFVSNQYGNYDVFTVNEKGTKKNRLTNTLQDERLPRFSPDGKKIAYLVDNGTDNDIFIMDIDGSNKKNLTPWPSDDIGVQFSRDGKKIAFMSDKGGDYEIYIANLSGANLRKLTSNNKFDGGPVFSIDNQYIYWASGISKKVSETDIYRMKIDGSNKVRYTSHLLDEGVDSVSFDGKWLAASAERDNDWKIFIYSADGKKVSRFTKNNFYNSRAIFAPKSYKLAWTAKPTNKWDIFVSDLRRPNEAINLTKSKGDNFRHDWSTDAKRIIFESNRSGNWHIYKINPDGSNLKRVTKGDYDNREPAWKP